MESANEKWSSIPGYEGLYEASNLGRVRSLERIENRGCFPRKRAEKILNQDNGRVRLSVDGVAKNFAISELVQSLFPQETHASLNQEGERWLPIRGHEGFYEVSNLYRVRRLARMTNHDSKGGERYVSAKLIDPHRNNGYLVVHLWGGDDRPHTKFYVEAEVENLFPDAKLETMEDVDLLEGEEWLPIAGYEGLYEISNMGRVKSLGWYVNGIKRRYIRPKILVGGSINDYPKVELANDGKIRTCLVHRLVAIAFVPNPLNLPIVHHKDENKTNPRFDNLEWTTRGGNVQDWFDRRRIVISADTIEAILAAGLSGKSPAEILAALPKKRKTGK